MARRLRQQLGDAEQLLNWYRAGFSADEVLRLRDAGVQNVFTAVQQRDSGQAPVAGLGRGFYGQESLGRSARRSEPPKAEPAQPSEHGRRGPRAGAVGGA